jgi:arylformamidase
MTIYRGMDRAALDAAYNNSAAVKDSARIVAGWQARSDKLRPSARELVYGPKPRNRIDFFEAGPEAPLLVFIHGGYWQMRSKDVFSCLAAGPLAQGISVAMVGYTLAPDIRLEGIVAEIRAALDFLDRNLVVSGWSAGGHLTAMAMSHPRVKAGLAISGIYDLEPMRLCYLNDKLRLDEAEVERNSPMRLPCSGKPLVLAYGTGELAELQRQSQDYAKVCKGATLLPMEGDDHFSLLEKLASPEGALTSQVRALAAQALRHSR